MDTRQDFGHQLLHRGIFEKIEMIKLTPGI
jgi:hypothetical protein